MYSPSGECSGEAARWSVAGVSVGATVAASKALAAMVRAAQESEAKLVTHTESRGLAQVAINNVSQVAVVNAPPRSGISVNGHTLVPLHSLIPAVEQVNASADEPPSPKGKKQQPVMVSVIGKREPLKARQAFSQCPETWRARAANTAGAFI